jgi:drug/metabolite transporter (DMT)-like permease
MSINHQKIKREDSEKAAKVDDVDDEQEGEIEENAVLELENVSSLVSSRHSISKKAQHHDIKYDHLLKAKNGESQDKDENEPSGMLSIFLGMRGSGLALFSAMITPISLTLVKKAHLFNGFEQALIRYTMGFIMFLPYAKFKKLNMFGPKKQRKLLTVRALIGVAGLLCVYFALSFVTPSDAGALAQINIVLTALVARFVLDERLTLAHIVAMLLTLSGAMFICQPTFLFSNNSLIANTNTNLTKVTNIGNSTSLNSEREGFLYSIGLLIAFCDAICLCLVQIVIKKLCMLKVNVVVINIYTSYLGVPVCAVAALLFHFNGITKRSGNESINELAWHFGLICFVAVLGTFNQLIMNLSLKYEDASKVALIKTSELFFTFVFQYLILNITSGLFNMIGAMLIISSTLLILIFKFMDQRHQDKLIPSQTPNIFKRVIFFKF